MYVKAFTSFQYRLVARAVLDQWHLQRSLIRARTVQVIDQLQTGHTDDFQSYVDDLVRPLIFV
jgi:hypothetical protein